MILTTTGYAIIYFCIGVLVGLGLAFFVLPGMRRARKTAQELEELREEHARYKTHVSDHFQETARLVHVMTGTYKQVYEHLASGAQTLCEGDAGNAVSFEEPKLIGVGEVPAAGPAAGPAVGGAAAASVENPAPGGPEGEASASGADAPQPSPDAASTGGDSPEGPSKA